MPRSRTIKTLAALLVAMTAGTFLLLALETMPAKPGQADTLAARLGPSGADVSRTITDTSIPIRADKWQYIVIHDSAGEAAGHVGDTCHFVIENGQGSTEDGRLVATENWRRQEDGTHVLRDGYRTHSIGICLVGNLDSHRPTPLQMERLIALVRALQAKHRISAEHVYRDDDLTGSGSPGLQFPDGALRNNLLVFNLP